MAFIPTNTILKTWAAAIAALTDPTDSTGATPLFAAASIFSDKNLVEAYEKTLTFTDRSCFLIPSGDSHVTEVHGLERITSRMTEITMIVGDRNYNPYTNAALIGDGASQIGVVALKDLLITRFEGDDLGLGYPIRAEVGLALAILVNQAERDELAGREVWEIQWRVPAGRMAAKQDRVSGKITR